MIVYFSLLIPILTIIYLLSYYKREVVWWEVLVVLVIPIVCVIGVKVISKNSLIYTTEYWNSPTTQAIYYEDWDEKVPCCHTRFCTDSKGDSYACGTLHAYDVDYHPERWVIHGGSGERLQVSKNVFEMLSKRWNSRKFKDMHRSYHSDDGDAYIATWDQKFESMEPIATVHKYKNKVKCTDSVFNFKKIDPKVTKVFEYNQPYGYVCNYIYGESNKKDQDLLRKWNAKIGAKKKALIIIIVFKGQISAAMDQEAYWKGGNKNEFVVCVGTNKSNDIKWTHVISWTPQTILKAQIMREVKEMEKLDMPVLINYLGSIIENTRGFIRRDFEEFDYLNVPVPLWGIIVCYMLSLILSIGLGIFVVKNDQVN